MKAVLSALTFSIAAMSCWGQASLSLATGQLRSSTCAVRGKPRERAAGIDKSVIFDSRPSLDASPRLRRPQAEADSDPANTRHDQIDAEKHAKNIHAADRPAGQDQ